MKTVQIATDDEPMIQPDIHAPQLVKYKLNVRDSAKKSKWLAQSRISLLQKESENEEHHFDLILFWLYLMKGELSVDPSFQPLAIKKPTIHLRSPLVAFDGHHLHYCGKSIPWAQKAIINCTYSHQWKVLMVLCSDWKLYVFNSNLDLIGRLMDWESKYSVGFEYVEQLGSFLLIGVIEVEMMKVSIKTNLKETKFLSSIKFGIERTELRSVQEKNRLSWNKGYGYDKGENLLYVWSTQNINFYSLNKLELQSSIVKLVKKETSITYVHLNKTYKYTITGLYNGNLKVWRLPLSPITTHTAEYIMIHNCVHHTKPVEKVVPASDHRLVLSASEDLTLCLWSLETFQLLRAYNFEGDYTNLFLVDQKRAFAIQNSQLGELTFGKTMEFIMEVDSPIGHFDKAVAPNGSWNSFQITLESNVGVEIRNSQLHKSDLNKMEIGYFYPPLKAQSIRQVLACPYDPPIYYMLVEKGELFSLRFEDNASKIEQSFSIQHAQDSENHSLYQTPTYIAFLDLPNIIFDSQITESGLGHKETPVELSSVSKELKLITIGCNKGSIVIISLDKVDKIRTRLTYHRQMITSIQVIHSHHGYNLASICAENYLRLISIENDKANCYFALNFGDSLKFMRSFEDKLMLVFKKGIFEIASAVHTEELKVAQNLDAVYHEGEIQSIDIEPTHRLIMTAGSDNRIKIWSTIKVLIYQIKLDEGLKYAIWSNRLEIFVAHRNKLLYLRDFTIDTADILQKDIAELAEDQGFVLLGLRECFASVRREQEKEKKELEEYLDANYSAKSKRKAHSVVEHHSFNQQDDKAPKSRNLSFLIAEPQASGHPKIPKKKKSSVRSKGGKVIVGSYTSSLRAEEQYRKQLEQDLRLKATRKHMQELNSIKQLTKESLLPKIKAKQEDKFQQFINAKLINKKMLTRRDITLNRIIMKNLIKEQFTQEEEDVNQLKLDF